MQFKAKGFFTMTSINTESGLSFSLDLAMCREESCDCVASIPNGFAAFKEIPAGGLVQLLFFVEMSVMKDHTGEYELPGDFRNGAIDFGWDTFTEEEKLQKRAVELNNGRAAMMGILGLMVHECIIPLGYDPELPIIGHLV